MRNTLLTLVLALTASLVVPASAEAQTPQTREGFWFNIGLGVGSAGCDLCDGRDSGGIGAISLGGTLSDQWLLGVASTAWVREEVDGNISLATLTALARFYPSRTGGFFLQAGLGVGTLSVDVYGYGSGDESGGGALLGLGYDIRIARNVSLTPFLNGAGISFDGGSFNFSQLGLSLTVH